MNSYQQEQINRRLALLCGVDQQMLGWWDEYLDKKEQYRRSHHPPTFKLLQSELARLQADLDGFELADYCNDLNALYKAEKALWHHSPKLFDDYIRAIYNAVDKQTTNGEVGLEVLDPFETTVALWRYADAPMRATAMYDVLTNQPTE